MIELNTIHKKIELRHTSEIQGKVNFLDVIERDLYSSTIVQVIKLRRMRWVEHVAWMGEGRGVYRVLVG
jgi:hypothetical protein